MNYKKKKIRNNNRKQNENMGGDLKRAGIEKLVHIILFFLFCFIHTI